MPARVDPRTLPSPVWEHIITGKEYSLSYTVPSLPEYYILTLGLPEARMKNSVPRGIWGSNPGERRLISVSFDSWVVGQFPVGISNVGFLWGALIFSSDFHDDVVQDFQNVFPSMWIGTPDSADVIADRVSYEPISTPFGAATIALWTHTATDTLTTVVDLDEEPSGPLYGAVGVQVTSSGPPGPVPVRLRFRWNR